MHTPEVSSSWVQPPWPQGATAISSTVHSSPLNHGSQRLSLNGMHVRIRSREGRGGYRENAEGGGGRGGASESPTAHEILTGSRCAMCPVRRAPAKN